MKRRARRQTERAVSLFPFLAVLICTMGALIVLLVIVVQQARVHAATVSENTERREEIEQLAEKLRNELEDQNWRADVLREQRELALQQLADKRLELAHLEQHIREIEQRWKSLQTEVAAMQHMANEEHSSTDQLNQQREALRRTIAKLQQEVEDAKRRAAERPRTFTIVPYPGPNGTTRRPLYIECTERGIVLRPENIVLGPEDFDGPTGPGNPLDAALRTMREYYQRNDPNARGEPYPLLIIRPDGVAAYVVAREAMSAWEDEFGYELVSQELVLNYPPPDPNLASLLQRAIEDARQRQQRLRMAMPSFPRGGGFIVSDARGGVVPLDGWSDGPQGSGQSGVGFGRGGPSTGRGDSRSGGANQATAASRDKTTGRSPSEATTASGNAPAGDPSQGGTGGPSSFQPYGAMAKTRGQDWALRKKSSGATGYRRPVRVVCQKEALILMPEPGSSDPPREFPFARGTNDHDAARAMDQFVQALQQRMERWGLPPLGGYWRPQLIMDVAPDAAHQFQMITALLEDSGLEIVTSQP